VIQGIVELLPAVAKGGTEWASFDDLTQLQEAFGLKASFKRLDLTALAAQSRVLHWELLHRTFHKKREDLHTIQSKIAQRDLLHRGYKWINWYDNFYLQRLFQTEDLQVGFDSFQLGRVAGGSG
jgi:hypothetical protein